MESLKELYKIGNGPSSSHTMGPKKAAERFAERCHDADAYRVTLYGSLAATGKGHLTDAAILSVLEPLAPTEIVWKPEVVLQQQEDSQRLSVWQIPNLRWIMWRLFST